MAKKQVTKIRKKNKLQNLQKKNKKKLEKRKFNNKKEKKIEKKRKLWGEKPGWLCSGLRKIKGEIKTEPLTVAEIFFKEKYVYTNSKEKF